MLSSSSRISSVPHQLSCFVVGLLLCCFTGGLFLCLTPFLWSKVSDLSAGLLLSACCDGLLIIFQFCSVVWICMLLICSGDELCGPIPALFQTAAYHLPAFGPSAFPDFVYWKFMRRSAPCSSPLLQCIFSNWTPLLCVSFQFLIYYSVFYFCFCFYFFSGREVSLPRGLCWFIPGVVGGIPNDASHSLFGLLNVSQAGLELASGSCGSPPVFSV
jgi:hypothetical protein